MHGVVVGGLRAMSLADGRVVLAWQAAAGLLARSHVWQANNARSQLSAI